MSDLPVHTKLGKPLSEPARPVTLPATNTNGLSPMAAERQSSRPTISDFAEECALAEIRLQSGSYTSERFFALGRQAHTNVTELSRGEPKALLPRVRPLQNQSLAVQHSNVEASRWPQDGGPLIE